MFRTSFCAVPAFSRVEPARISGPTTTAISRAQRPASSDPGTHTTQAVKAPAAAAARAAPRANGVPPLALTTTTASSARDGGLRSRARRPPRRPPRPRARCDRRVPRRRRPRRPGRAAPNVASHSSASSSASRPDVPAPRRRAGRRRRAARRRRRRRAPISPAAAATAAGTNASSRFISSTSSVVERRSSSAPLALRASVTGSLAPSSRESRQWSRAGQYHFAETSPSWSCLRPMWAIPSRAWPGSCSTT